MASTKAEPKEAGKMPQHSHFTGGQTEACVAKEKALDQEGQGALLTHPMAFGKPTLISGPQFYPLFNGIISSNKTLRGMTMYNCAVKD